ncbi:stalk domain-containing protein [Anaeromicrobium sediminis]|uniref:Copper amine oxidase-like N-terminal domain-containing protein n=1 Tax=Anaeromicrobium sediminis TaxID=1478221 RepID=A0A267MQG0_9FIRM|nr:stalk domain-containing protein [Anaeromicrobium sediminis]PAB61013.1 hypothetical protein CCE28_00865 [Anaeromicrobium sediminis]
MKKVFLLTLVCIFVLGGLAYAEGNELSVYVNNEKVNFPNAKSFINDDLRTLVPLRFVPESLGATVGWNSERNAVLITTETSNEEVKKETIADKELTGNPILDMLIANAEGVEKALVDNVATYGIASYASGTKSKIVIRTGDWVLSDDYDIEISIEDYQKSTSYVYWDILNEIFPTEAEQVWNDTDTKATPQTDVRGVADGKQYKVVNYTNTISVYVKESK